jgi:choline dehydrogenase-like flavoprotein
MILDLNQMDGPSELSADVCIVGSGAAGLALASEMLGSRNTIILESGALDHEPPTQALYDVDVSGLPHPGSTQGRFRICGGSTTKWGGQALPLMSSDFETREWIPYSGWPISADELSPYYARAHRFLFLDQMNFDTDLFRHLRTAPPAINQDTLWYHFSKWSPTPNIRERYIPGIRAATRSTLLFHANVIAIDLTPSCDRVRKIHVRSFNGRTAAIHAREFVLCTGGIETPRLLLANDSQQPNGIGNQYDLVGRFFQDHPSATIGYLKHPDPLAAQRLFNVFHKAGLKYSVRCTATPGWQRDHRTLNISMGSTLEYDDSFLQDLKAAYLAARQTHILEAASKAIRAARHPRSAISPVWHFLRHRRTFVPNARLRIGLTSEQEPNPESRILLSPAKDALGMRRANVRWKLTDLTIQTIRGFANSLSHEFQRTGLGSIELDSWLNDDSADWTAHVTDQYHHIGTTRMHRSPRCGVVDPNCKVHSVSNLYIGSSAVFPTSGHSNPTLTIIALTIRLADHLKTKLTSDSHPARTLLLN